MIKDIEGKFSASTFLIAVGTLLLMLLLVPLDGFAQTSKVEKGRPKLPRIVDVGADKCIPCIMMAPILEELKKEYAGVLIVEFVDVWKNPEGAKQYGARGIPTQIFYDANGKELKRHLGYISKQDILDEFQKLGISLKPSAKKRT
ncbi:MAG: Thioredoxin [Deltaproteobacteria bacterium]|nr:Thioredoxin [Deltaproteobacteria bacterium]